MSDLITYSIMKPSLNTQPSYSTNINTCITPKHSNTIILPPLAAHNSPPSLNNLHINSHIVLPPIQNQNYTFNKPILKSTNYFSSPCDHQLLTESNLLQFETSRNTHGLGLLSSAILYDQQSFQDSATSSKSNSESPSLTSASSVTSVSTPNTPELNHNQLQPTKQIQQSHSHSQTESVSPNSKRRQRLGPSCDSCRIRKVKCNAEITIISKDLSQVISLYNLSIEDQNTLINDSALQLSNSDYSLIFNNDKFIKFKSCKSCTSKNLKCFFSKGFTKEDIMSKKKTSTTNSVKKPTHNNRKPNGDKFDDERKSSCNTCRKRKIKCIFNNETKKCEACSKKNHHCNFDKK